MTMMKNQRTGGEDPIVAEWLPARHQGSFDPAIVLQKMLQGFCHPEMVLDLANQAIQHQTFQLPSGVGGLFDKEDEEGDLLHPVPVLLSPSSDELSVDSIIQLADPEGRDESVSKVATNNNEPADLLGSLLPTTDNSTGADDDDKKLSQSTPSTTTTSCTVWHVLQIFVSILVGLYLSHATLPPQPRPTAHRVVVGIENNDLAATTVVLPVPVTTPPPDIHSSAEKERSSSWHSIGPPRHRRSRDVDAIRRGGD